MSAPERFTRAAGGHQQLLEFYVGENAVVDQRWADLVAAGHPSRMPPPRPGGQYAAMVEDPDGNVVLLPSDEAARTTRTTRSVPSPAGPSDPGRDAAVARLDPPSRDPRPALQG